MPTITLTQLSFQHALTAWLETRRPYLAPRTFLDYQNYIKTLSAFFGEMKIQEITADQVRGYQRMRMARAGSGMINKECSVLVQIRKRIGQPLQDHQALPQSRDYESPGRALTEDEEEKLVRVCKAAADHPLWDVAALATLLSMRSGLGPGEILSLKLRHVSLNPPKVEVPLAGAKRIKRARPVPLEEDAALALKYLISRAHEKCLCADPDHYLIPKRNRDHSYDPTKPAKGWREGLRALLAISEIECRRYDFRHHAVSKALRDPSVSKEAAKAYFGWISPKMFQRYFHADMKTLNVVAAAIGKKPSQPVQKADRPLKIRQI